MDSRRKQWKYVTQASLSWIWGSLHIHAFQSEGILSWIISIHLMIDHTSVIWSIPGYWFDLQLITTRKKRWWWWDWWREKRCPRKGECFWRRLENYSLSPWKVNEEREGERNIFGSKGMREKKGRKGERSVKERGEGMKKNIMYASWWLELQVVETQHWSWSKSFEAKDDPFPIYNSRNIVIDISIWRTGFNSVWFQLTLQILIEFNWFHSATSVSWSL